MANLANGAGFRRFYSAFHRLLTCRGGPRLIFVIIMKCISLFPILLVLACQSCRQPSANLVQNGSAELPPVDSTPLGWKNISGHWKSVEGDSIHHDYAWAEEGKRHFFEGQDTGGVLEQTIDVKDYATSIDGNKQQALFSGFVQVFPQDPPDQTQILLGCYATAGAKPLYVFNSDTLSSESKWTHVVDSFMIPPSTRLIKVTLIAHRRNGADDDGYFDDITLTTRGTGPALATWIIIAAAAIAILLVVGIIRFKKKKSTT